jgi:hypothetical protein
MSRFCTGIWFDDPAHQTDPWEFSYDDDGYIMERQGDDIVVKAPNARVIALYTRIWTTKVAVPLLTHQMSRAATIVLAAVVLFVSMYPLPPSIRYHYGRKHYAVQTASVMAAPDPLSPFVPYHGIA